MTTMLRFALALALSAMLPYVAGAQQHVEASKYIVASGHPAATAAGLDVLRHGGNVIDAAIATSLCVGVALPYGSGLGGKMVMLYREAASGAVYCVDASCAAPARLDAKAFVHLPLSEQRFGYTSTAVPGLPAGLWAAHQKWGARAWSDLVEPAAALADDGVAITEDMHSLCAPDVYWMRNDPEASRLYLQDGESLPAGCTMKNPDLAATLRRFAARGVKEFYEGETAQRIVAAARDHGSAMALDDLRTYGPKFVEPLAASYRGHRIYTSAPPQIGGLTVLLTLKALEKQRWQPAEPRNLDYVDAVGRMLLCVYPRVERGTADLPTAYQAARRLLTSSSIAKVRAAAAVVDPKRPRRLSSRDGKTLDDLADASTSHLIVADRAGNIVSLTQSLSFHFGAGVVAPGTGILLNNSLSNFCVTSPRSSNYIAAGKRPRSTMAPIIVTRGDAPVMALGIPGGQRIPTTSIQLMVNVFDFKMSLVEAFNQRRFHVRRPVWPEDDANVLDLEGPSPAGMRKALSADGWQVVMQPPDGRYFGGGNAVAYEPDGRLLGVADERRSNLAGGD